MAKTNGQVDPDDYPAGMRAMFARTQKRTIWDAGATTWDHGRTHFDSGKLGARLTRRCVRHENPQVPHYVAGTTWDTLTTTWDTGATIWDRVQAGFEPATNYGKNLALQQAYGHQHDALDGWKRVRWNLCGILRGMTGRNLYIQCCRAQNTTLGKQPISPCSRRATDPLASPFDFTP